jgi:alkylation response protein AidB-like acyl-CoA dehydrogenase
VALGHLADTQEDEREVRDRTAEFVKAYLLPTVEEDDQNCVFRKTLFHEVAKLGFHSYTHSPKYGGKGGSHRAYYGFLEELGRGSLAFSVAVGVTNLVQGALAAFGTEAQKEQFLRPLVSGNQLAAFSLSEPQSGSDAAALRLQANKAEGGYLLQGTKCWCSNAADADLFLVIARTGVHKSKGISAFLVPKDTPGFRTGKLEKKLGLRASSLAELIFEECFIPTSQRLGKEGQGFQIALSQLDAGRISIGAAGVAAASEALERVTKHFLKDAVGSEAGTESLEPYFAGYLARLLAIKTLIGAAATRRDKGENVTVMASSIKLLASDLAVEVCHDAVHYMGYEGCRTGSGVERLLRDAKALQIVEGTNQIQRLVLSRTLNEMFGK